MKLSYNTMGCPTWDIRQIVDNAVKYQMQGVELFATVKKHISPDFTPEKRKEIKELFKSNGLQISCIAAYTRFSMGDGQERQKNEDILLSFVDLAEDLECRNVRTFIGKVPEGKSYEEVYDYAAQSLNRVAGKMENSKTKIVIETHDHHCTAALIKPVLDRITSPKIGILWDMAHSYRAGEELKKTYDLIGQYIHHVHLKDEFYDKNGNKIHCIPGEGVMPILECRDLLITQGYDGHFSLEWEKYHQPEMPELNEALPRYCQLMKSKNHEE